MNGRFARRLAIVAIALLLSAVLLRGAMSSALVSRGDELEIAGDGGRAIAKYKLAIMLDHANAVALDRFAFSAIRSHRTERLRETLRLMGASSIASPQLIMDRALCLHLLGEYSRAAFDFEAAGMKQHDARALLFAALDQRRAHHIARARSELSAAVAFDPAFVPAQAAYVRSKRW
jgi:tetratricopeptide (TPR) repeat protein